MAEPRSIRGFLKSRKHRRKHQASDSASEASVTSSFVSDTCVVVMEGMLKKRAAKMPVMHDRYCVATWELDAHERKCVMLRSYKSRKAYDAHPEKPSSVHQLKCISDWDGKTGFHRYQHAFTMETRDKKLFQCVAPCAADKDKWLELMAVQSAFHSSRDMRLGSVGSLVPLRRTQSVESAADEGKPRAYTSASIGKKRGESDVNSNDVDHSTDSEDHVNFPQDGLFRTTSGASSNELPNEKNEPADWGLYGEAAGETKSKYEVHDAKPVLLDRELLDTRGETKTLASDKFLFDEAGASRFGAVVVKAAETENDDEEFIDEQFAARKAKKENEKNMRRRAQKLESNRDLYAEMAAARLANMRKDARHPKKSHSHSRPSVEGEESEDYNEDESMLIESGDESVAEVEELHQRNSSRSRRSSKSPRKSYDEDVSENTNGYVSGDAEEEEEEEVVHAGALGITEMESAEVEELRELKKKYRAERRAKKRLIKEKEEEEQTALEAAELARAHREEQRAREEAKVREEQEKRDKKERREMKEKLKREKAKQRQAETELRKLVELKQAEEERRERERIEKKERKEKKEKKKAKKKEKYTLPAERIHRKEERDAERAAESAAAAAKEAEAEISNALVVVEKPAESEPTQHPLVAPVPSPTSTSSSVPTEAVPTEQVAPTPVAVPTPVVASAPVPTAAVVASAPVPAPATESVPAYTQAMPMYQMVPPPFVPSYPVGPQNMPAYGLAATFGAYPPFYTSSYSYGGPVGPQPTYMNPNMSFVAGLSAMGSFGKTAGPEPAPSSQDTVKPMIGPQLPTAKERAVVSLAGTNPLSAPPPPPSCDKKLTNLPELPDVIEF
ncbi:Cell-cell adhesion protein [Phytophthora megakarya]|uniref:Cell-cell adhesion protein n=1 Tax=Phytophthora megakarya TaxID=4795 RepID=A0A225WM39_9STRA|nr:Cell-cell adhesion protein [Phytophthora megakarya]